MYNDSTEELINFGKLFPAVGWIVIDT